MKKIAAITSLFSFFVLTDVLPGAIVYDLSRQFTVVENPNMPWVYGATAALGGSFVTAANHFTGSAGNGVTYAGWRLPGSPIQLIQGYPTDRVATDASGGVFEPGTIILFSGEAAVRYGVARFTVPSDGAGHYRIETVVHSYYSNSSAGDTDYHVLRNNVELFGQFLPGNSGTAYTNELDLGAGDRIDFVAGPGADGSAFSSGLKIFARLTTQCPTGTNSLVVTNMVVLTNTLIVTNVVFIPHAVFVTNAATDCVTLANLAAAVDASGLPFRVTQPLRANIQQAARGLRRVDLLAQSRVAPRDAALAAELQALVRTLLGLPSE